MIFHAIELLIDIIGFLLLIVFVEQMSQTPSICASNALGVFKIAFEQPCYKIFGICNKQEVHDGHQTNETRSVAFQENHSVAI